MQRAIMQEMFMGSGDHHLEVPLSVDVIGRSCAADAALAPHRAAGSAGLT